MPNIANVKHQHDNNVGGGKQQPRGMVVKTESMDQETANTSKMGGQATSHHKGITASKNTNNYVKVQNSEISSAGTADAMFQGGMPSTNNYTTAGRNSQGIAPHTIGNSLGGNQKQSLNMSNYGGYFTAI